MSKLKGRAALIGAYMAAKIANPKPRPKKEAPIRKTRAAWPSKVHNQAMSKYTSKKTLEIK